MLLIWQGFYTFYEMVDILLYISNNFSKTFSEVCDMSNISIRLSYQSKRSYKLPTELFQLMSTSLCSRQKAANWHAENAMQRIPIGQLRTSKFTKCSSTVLISAISRSSRGTSMSHFNIQIIRVDR